MIISRSMLVEDFYQADTDADADGLVESSTSILPEMMMLDDGHAIGIN